MHVPWQDVTSGDKATTAEMLPARRQKVLTFFIGTINFTGFAPGGSGARQRALIDSRPARRGVRIKRHAEWAGYFFRAPNL